MANSIVCGCAARQILVDVNGVRTRLGYGTCVCVCEVCKHPCCGGCQDPSEYEVKEDEMFFFVDDNQTDPDAELENARVVLRAKRKKIKRAIECVVMTVALVTAPVWIPLGFTIGVSMRVWEILTSLRERAIYGDC